MDGQGYNLAEVIQSINPSTLEYTQWIEIGMALHHEGYGFDVWDSWSRQDTNRYKGNGGMERKWQGFGSATNPVKGGTIVDMARSYGWEPSYRSDLGYALDWGDTEVSDDRVVKDAAWIEPSEISEPTEWNPAQQIIEYLETVFDADEIVGYVTDSWQKDDRWIPANKGDHTRTAGELIEAVSKYKGDIASALGDYDKKAGAWIRFNPLDGNGVRNDNVAEFKHALIESDSMELEKQKAIIEELELPVSILVHSGGKSLHAIVRVDAKDYNEYRKRVDYLYSICRKNGLEIDTQNKNPSRLSRLPGCVRSDNKQFIVAKHIGKESWADWHEWIESLNDNLPDPEDLSSVWDNLPALSPSLIEGVLRQGHKMLLAGPSKAGKSYALIELVCAIAEGREWLGFSCAQGKVLYINLELDSASCMHRFKDVYASLEWEPTAIDNIKIWNLRGKAAPMDKLAPSIIRRASKEDYTAIIIDPIYKVITGDENSADQMANFCNQFDKICNELGCAVIYCHHHSKGHQGSKRSMDRASGSGVFARDPDAQLDLIELELTEAITKQQESDFVCAACETFMTGHGAEGWQDLISQDDHVMGEKFLDACRALTPDARKLAKLSEAVHEGRKAARARTAWRIEGILREFPSFPPVNMWFEHPRHVVDRSKVLDDLESQGESNQWSKKPGKNRQKKTAAERKKERRDAIEAAFEACAFDNNYSLGNVASFLGVTEKTARNHIKEHGDFWIDEGVVGRKK